MNSRQRKMERKRSGQTRLASIRAKDDERELVRLASGSDTLQGKHVAKSGKASIRHTRACQYYGAGVFSRLSGETHGRTFIRRDILGCGQG